jgi:SAM-dependent methyltransferase
MGFDMGHPSFRSEEWVASYDPNHPEVRSLLDSKGGGKGSVMSLTDPHPPKMSGHQRPLVDIGCGLGTNALHAVSNGARVVAVDMTEAHLTQIREKAGQAVLASGQLETR